MDAQLKERLIGAAVLAAVAIIILPVVLDGPDEESRTQALALPPADTAQPQGEVQTYRFTLDEAGGGADPQQPDADRDAAREPAPEAAAADAEPVPRQATEQTPPASRPAEAAAAEPAGPQSPPAESAVAEGAWAVQVGSFSEVARAERYAAELRDKGFVTFVTRFASGGTTYHRVRVGPQATRAEAERVAERIRQATGGPAKVVSND